jgi:signal transduction histidine kinase
LLADNSDSSKVVTLFDTRGKEVHLLFKHLVLDQPNKRKPFIALSFIDISDLIKQESETNKALQIVSEQNRKLLNFSYIVSHNIRSHASNISGFLQLAESENDVSALHVYLDALSKSSKALDGTLRHLNELLNIQSRVGVHPVPIDLNEIVVKTIAALSSDLSQIPHSFQFDFSNPFMIHADQAYADSIILNLISNAIKYRKSDVPLEIIISAKKQNDESIIYVKDNGKGIDLDKYGEKVFGMFKTFHGNRDARGIGLFITKNQIESMGGSIHLESSPGNGATFTIYLPD